ncbi:MAG: MotA/TolQ/ExbB proton channel family protein [Verrucomicrobiota bacterium]|nr:MotA/TolQ/ExbB proton channel family protein [Verrucomicrobiota bacterium]
MFELLHQGGPVMWPLVFLSLFGFVIFIERALYLHKGQIRTKDFLAGIKNLLRKRRLVEALTVCEETPGPVPIIVKAALLHHDEGENRMRGAVQAAAIVEIPMLERRIASLAAIARVSPILGLLGTVTIMYKTLQLVQAEGAYAHQGVVAGGLSESLVVTAFGLLIAVLAQLTFHFLSGRVRALVTDMEYSGHEIMQFLLRELPHDDKAVE